DLSIFEPDYSIRLGNDGGVVGDEDEGHAMLAIHPSHQADDLLAGLAVDLSGRLVAENQRWLVDQGARDRDPLLFASRHLIRAVMDAVDQPDFIQQRGSARLAILAVLAVAQGQHHVLDSVESGQKVEVLEDESELPRSQFCSSPVAKLSCIDAA